MRIGVFDSGIGGLTVLKKIMKKYPNNEYIYYGDTKNMPFGDKSIDELKIISSNIIEFLIARKVDIIVIACGTISSNLLHYLKRKYSIPIYDIISGIVNYLNNSNYENISVLCTEQTKDSKIFETKINRKVKVISCRSLANLIEDNNINKIELYIKNITNELQSSDVIVLGCTHYPLISNIIKKYINIPILDMADYLDINIKKNSINKLEMFFSSDIEKNIKKAKKIIKVDNF